MRGNAYAFRRPSQCELSRAQMNSVCDLVITALSGQSDVANDIAVQMHLNGCRLNRAGR